MNKNRKRGIIIGLCLIVICACIYGVWSLNQDVGYYEYPVIGDQLDAMSLVNDGIPEKTLRRMTDEQLAQAVADFPLLGDVYAFDSLEDGVKALAKKSDAYEELLSRKNGKEALIEKVKELEEKTPDSIAIEILKMVILHEESFQDTLTEEEIYFLKGK